MACHHDMAHVDLPSSPPPSALSTPACQDIDRSDILERLNVSHKSLRSFKDRFNRVEFHIMNDARFEQIVLDSVTNRYARRMYGEEAIEAEIERHMGEAVDRLNDDFEEAKYVVLRQTYDLGDDQDLDFYLGGLLPADNLYDIRSYVAYGIGPILKRLGSKGLGRSDKRRPPRKRPAGRTNQARPAPKPSVRSLKVVKALSTPRPSSPESNATMILRRSARLAQRHSQPQRIRKTRSKAK